MYYIIIPMINMYYYILPVAWKLSCSVIELVFNFNTISLNINYRICELILHFFLKS